MRILTGRNIRSADLYTIENEPISSLDLMERASVAMACEISDYLYSHGFCAEEGCCVTVFAGKGNNGGDGLAVARLLSERGFKCKVVVFSIPENMTCECRINYMRLPSCVEKMTYDEYLNDDSCFTDGHSCRRGRNVVIDALLGSGLTGRVRGNMKKAVEYINGSGLPVISLDLPSGMPSDIGVPGDADFTKDMMVHADMTVTVEFPKIAMLLPQFGDCAGEIRIVHIGLSEDFMKSADEKLYYVDGKEYSDFMMMPGRYGGISGSVSPFMPKKFSHKGSNGHVLLVCGKKGMAGAAVLAAGAALRSGCGLVTVHMPVSERAVMHVSHPSAIVSCDCGECFSELPVDMSRYTAVGVGCGLGTDAVSAEALADLMRCGKPMVLDADALNIIAALPELKDLIPPCSILTPHPGELSRLVGRWSDEADKIWRARRLAEETGAVVIVKGAHTMTVAPDGKLYFNSTGTPGMAKGGSGDVLAGYVSGLLARGADPLAAAVVGVYRHGKAGEAASHDFGIEAMNASDIAGYLNGRI